MTLSYRGEKVFVLPSRSRSSLVVSFVGVFSFCVAESFEFLAFTIYVMTVGESREEKSKKGAFQFNLAPVAVSMGINLEVVYFFPPSRSVYLAICFSGSIIFT